MLSITDDDIAMAESCLLRSRQTFDAQRCEVIKCLTSTDVLACPGSGKTTTLLAKLLIISSQLPLEGNRGICVLTHTNVAIDTITRNVGLSAGKLFNYPNHFGTIQSFVDKYLASPAYVEMYGRRPDIIDNDWYYAKVDKQLKYLPNPAKSFCHKNSVKGYPHSIRFCDLAVSKSNTCDALKLDLNAEKDKCIYDGLLRLKRKVREYGVLSYDDAYYLASNYASSHPCLRRLFSKRFAFVFIDEMQDTDSKQTKLLGHLFDDSVVMQRIGDGNQAIFDFNSMDEDCQWPATQINSQLEITGSKRFSNAIAKVIAPICVNPQALTGNESVPDIKPVLIAFADANIQQVIPRFAALTMERKLHFQPQCCFKALGWIGKPHEIKHTIPSYWPAYQKELHRKASDYPSLADYLEPESDEFIQQHSVNHYRKSIIQALLKCLRVSDRPSPSPLLSERALFNYISRRDEEFENDLRRRLAKWCLSIHRKQPVLGEIITYIQSDFGVFFGITKIAELEQFLDNPATHIPHETAQLKSNVYLHTHQGAQIEIQISTIHGAKGETHTATLYLETFYHEYDIVRIIEYLKGIHTPPKQKRLQQNLRMAYVGMSRPTHLLCVAVHKDHLVGHEGGLTPVGWEIDMTLA